MAVTSTDLADPTGRPAPDSSAPDPRWRSDGVSFGLVAVIAGALGIMAAYGEVFYDALVFLVVFGGLAVVDGAPRIEPPAMGGGRSV